MLTDMNVTTGRNASATVHSFIHLSLFAEQFRHNNEKYLEPSWTKRS